MRNIIAILSGVLFGTGLAVSGMADPNNVVNFLDLFGDWDPGLALVMVGAIGVNAPIYWLVVKRRKAPMYDLKFHLPARTNIDIRLVIGSILFGAGWGLSGYCPGAAIAAAVNPSVQVFSFLGAMGVGIFVHDVFLKRRSPSATIAIVDSI